MSVVFGGPNTNVSGGKISLLIRIPIGDLHNPVVSNKEKA